MESYTTNSAGTQATLNSIVARNGYTQTLNYGSGVLASVTDSSSRSITFGINSAGLLTSITTPDSTTISFGYSGTAPRDC